MLLLSMASLATALTLQAAGREEIAKDVAKNYCQNPTLKKTGFEKPSKLRSATVEKTPSYFVYADTNDDFCIVSADGNVIGYGKNYSDTFPPQLQDMLDDYSPSLTKRNKSNLRSATVRENVPYFMDVTYSQGLPYNNQCPIIDSTPAVTGCVATAMAQVLKYWEHPKQLQKDIPAYSLYPKNNRQFGKIHNPTEPAEGRTYNWENILNHYEGDTTDIYVDEIAKLMYDCGRSVEMMYGEHQSGAFDEMLPYALTHYFGYNSDSIQQLMRVDYYYEEWEDLLYKDIAKKRPVLFCGTNNDGGHAFVCDGYMDGLFHFNWGWNGSMNGYFDVPTLDPYDSIGESNGYSKYQLMISGIVPGKGEKVIEHPIFGKEDDNMPDMGESEVFTNFKLTDDSVLFNVKLYAVDTKINHKIFYIPAYINANGDTLFFQDRKPNDPSFELPMYDKDPLLKIQMKRSFDATYKGKELTFIIMESDKEGIIEKDGKTTGWTPSPLFDPITVKIPESQDITIKDIYIYDIWCKIIGNHINFSGTVYVPHLETGKDFLTLAFAADGDTVVSYDKKQFPWTTDQLPLDYDINLKKSCLNKDVYMIVMESDDCENWSMCTKYAPIKIKPSDLKVRSSSFIINSLAVNEENGSYYIDMELTNPTDYEVEAELIYEWYMEQKQIKKMIPSNQKISSRTKLNVPFYISETEYELVIYNDDIDIMEELTFNLDKNKHIMFDYSLMGNILKLNFSNHSDTHFQKDFIIYDYITPDNKKEYRESLDLEAGADTTLEIKFDFEIQSHNSIEMPRLELNDEYGVYCSSINSDIDINIYYSDEEIDIHGQLASNKETDIIIAVTSSLDKDAVTEYATIHLVPEDNFIFQQIIYSDYFKLKNPEYMCLCNADSSFAIITKLIWLNDSAPNVNANSNISVFAVDGGVWITSDVETSLSICSIDGKIVETVGLKPESSLFVPLTKGVYIVGDKKILIK